MSIERTAFLCPGQGSYIPGVLTHVAGGSAAADTVLAAIDAVAAEYGHRPVSALVLDRASPALDRMLTKDPDLIQLAVYATSMATSALLAADYRIRPDVVFGHSFGEISALTIAGVFGVTEGTRVVCERIAAVRRAAPAAGGLVAVATGLSRTGHLIAALDDWRLAPAAENSPSQTIVSGPDDALDQLEEAARVIGVKSIRLRVPRPFHNPAMAAAAGHFGEGLRAVPAGPPRIRFYSDVLGRYLDPDDDVKGLLCAHLVKPVRFLTAVRALHDDGVTRFVECGARDVLTRLVADCLPPVVAVAPLQQCVYRSALDQLLAPLMAGTSTVGVPPAAHREDPDGTVSAAPAIAASPLAATGPLMPAGADDAGTSNGFAEHGGLLAEPAPAGAILPSDADILNELRRIYSEALEYPPEVFTDNAELEAELGIDSLKQTEVLGQVLDHYGLTVHPDQIRATEYLRLPDIVGLLRQLSEA